MEAPRPASAPHTTSTPPTQNVRVVARIRPLSAKEAHSSECISTSSSSSSRVIHVRNEDKQFEFDSVFGPKASQEEVYRGTAGDMVGESIYRGFNGTILAYGQTGSGEYLLVFIFRFCNNN